MSANTEAGSAGIGDPEVQALEETVRRRCQEIEGLAHRSFSPGNTVCRESDFQLQAFAERRAEAFETLDRTVGESRETRMARLERTLEKLECSRSFFAQTAGVAAGHYSDQ
jgi:hypothetical protein